MSPDGPTNPPPEERLLGLIRKQTKPAVPPPAKTSAPDAPDRESPAAAAKAASASSASLIIQRLALPWPTIAVWGIAAVLAGEVIGLVALAMQPIPQVIIAGPPPSDGLPQNFSSPDELPSLAQSASPELFQAQAGASTSQPRPSGAPSASAKQLSTRLTLLGIVSGNPPQAIIEDSVTKKTYFVTAGQAVSEGAALQQVGDNRVVLDLNGEQIDLAL